MLNSNYSSSTIRRLSHLILGLLLLGALLVRLYQLDAPLGDWHSWRQSDTSAVSWLILNQQASLIKPRFFDISNTPSGLDNPNGWRFVEFPVYNLLQVKAYQLIKPLPWFDYPFEAAGRLVNITFWLIGGVFLYLLISRTTNRWLGLSVIFFYFFLPFNIYYSRTILPDPLMVSLSLISLFITYRLVSNPNPLVGVIGIITTALALLTKPYALFIIYPYLVLLGWYHKDKTKVITWLVGVGATALGPLTAWRWWMRAFPEGIPANKWLFNAGGMRLKPVWWRWLFYERLGKLISGGWLTSLLSLSLFTPLVNIKPTNRPVFNSLMIGLVTGSLAFLVIFARGNIQHDYYQVVITPAISLLMGVGLYLAFGFILQAKAGWWAKLIPAVGIIWLTLFGLITSWYQVKEYYKINDLSVIKTLEQLKNRIPPTAKVIADYQGNSLLLYHLKRFGWPILESGSVANLKQKGANYYLAPTPNAVTDQLSLSCQDIIKYQGVSLINLNSCRL